MLNEKNALVFVLYDGIENSVFESQVVAPLRAEHHAHPHKKMYVVSFENKPHRIQLSLPFCTVVLLKKYPFIGRWSLIFAIRSLKKVLALLSSYDLIARGPLAGYLSLGAAQNSSCVQITIQARGLLAEEYRYIHAKKKGIQKLLHTFRAQLFEQLERTVYSPIDSHCKITIQAVSSALKDYLIKFFHTNPEKITLAEYDFPKLISQQEKNVWRLSMRTQLKIDLNAPVYCYNGSAKRWQCPEETIIFFKKKLAIQKNAFLLVVTHEIKLFEQLITKHEINPYSYRIISVPHQEIYSILAAADYGIILREPHLLNWISRPTKVLEYHALGLDIIHNNTIALLAHPDQRSNPAISADSRLESDPPRTA